MKMFNLMRLLTTLCGVCLASGAHATVNEVAQKAASGVSSVATKAERAVKRGVEAGISGAERGAQATGRAVESTAKKIGLPTGAASSPKR